MDTSRKHNNQHPREKANVFSILFFWWMRDLFQKGLSKDLERDDLYNVHTSDVSESMGDQLERNWMEQLSKSERDIQIKPSLWKAMIATFYWSYFIPGILLFFYSIVFRALQPMFLACFIRYFSSKDDSSLSDAYLNALGLSVTALTLTLLLCHAYYLADLTGMRMRIACCSLLYRKIVHLSSRPTDQKDIGYVVNLMSNDVSRFDNCGFLLHFLWIAPIQAIVFTCIMWRSVGPAGLVGLGAIVLQSLPIQAYVATLTAKFRSKIAKRTDARVRLIGEIVSGIQVIKMYVWEKPFENMVEISRRLEINVLTKAAYLSACRVAVPIFAEKVALFVTLVTCFFLDYDITADKVFAIANMFHALQLSICIYLPNAIRMLCEMNVTIQRIQDFLLLEENEGLAPVGTPKDNQAVTLKNATAQWTPKIVVDVLSDVSLQVPKGQLCVVIGPVGAGKSSLLQAILGELPLSNGTISLCGEVAYASQEPWLFTGTVRQNILFGRQYDANRYHEVIRVCALQSDLDLFPNGDKSIVGERGVSLSGGQRARINLARAVYQKADIYLFDDPLSAVDMHVSNHLIHKCVNTFLANKTRILITHQIQHLQSADLIVIFKNGCIEHHGTFEELKALNIDITTFLPSNTIMEVEEDTMEHTQTSDEKDPNELVCGNDEPNNSPEACENEELMVKGKLKVSVYSQYWLAGSSVFGLVVMLLVFIAGQVATSSTDYWTSIWANSEELRKNHQHVSFHNLTDDFHSITPSWQEFLFNQTEDLNLTTISEANSSELTTQFTNYINSKNNFTWNITTSTESTELTSKFINGNNIMNNSEWNVSTSTEFTILENIKKETSNIKREIANQFNNSLDMNDTSTEYAMNVVKEITNTIYPTTNALFLSNTQQGKNKDNISDDTSVSPEDVLSTIDKEVLQEYTTVPLPAGNTSQDTKTSPNQQDNNTESKLVMYSANIYVTVYSILMVLTIVLVIARGLLFSTMCMKSSKGLHDTMFARLLRTNMAFFNTNPSGRILNRFSKDMGAVDELLPLFMLQCAQIIMVMLGIATLILVVNYMLVVLVVLTLAVFYKGRNIFLATAQDLQRLEGITKSPVFSHVSATLSGLPTIRSSGAQEMLRREFDTLQDNHTSAFELTLSASRSFSISMDLINVVFITVITFSFLLFANDVPGSDVGLAISQAMILSGMLNYGVVLSGLIACQMTSVERVLQYIQLPSETDLHTKPKKRTAVNWPTEGAIQYNNVNLKFKPSGLMVLKDINISIQPGRKIGIVGRTGAGKTSLVTTLFRLTPIEGSLLIDGVDIASLGLNGIRKKISIIPQDPVLFTTSLRNNLDPLGEYSDHALWNALEEVQLKQVVSSLDYPVNEGGRNFSVGQRQLLCLARAILKNNKILILDEATANIDLNTDLLIQKTIQLKFQDCTVLTVAHRLNTIMDSNTVIVMDAGKIVEQGHPHILLQNRKGFFHRMAQQTGREMRNQLEMVAEEAYKKHVEEEAKLTAMKEIQAQQHKDHSMKKKFPSRGFPGSQGLFQLHQVVQEAYKRHKESESEATIELNETNQLLQEETQGSEPDTTTEQQHDKLQEDIV